MSSLSGRAALLACLLGSAAGIAEPACSGPECQDETSQLQITRDRLSKQAPCPAPAPCPYNFNPPKCEDAEPQSPRDLVPRAPGRDIPKAATLTAAQANFLPLTNVHFHLGAEHRALDYRDGKYSEAWDAAQNPVGVRPGWECESSDLKPAQLAPYTFKYCKTGVEVGRTYEVHYVHSSAGYSEEDLEGTDIEPIDDGLGGAANGRGLLNPMIVVEGLIFQIVQGAPDLDAFNGWDKVADLSRAVMYPGSTTGTSYNNTICSPYSITWHVDRTCHRISPEAFDNLCKQNKEVYNLDKDLKAKSSRVLLDKEFVVQPKFVVQYA